jgi:hypothetical protein
MENSSLVARFAGWLKKPFSGDMDATHWFLFFGLMLVIVFLWSRILHYINKGVEL